MKLDIKQLPVSAESEAIIGALIELEAGGQAIEIKGIECPECGNTNEDNWTSTTLEDVEYDFPDGNAMAAEIRWRPGGIIDPPAIGNLCQYLLWWLSGEVPDGCLPTAKKKVAKKKVSRKRGANK